MANEYVSATVLKATLSLTGQTYADADVTTACTAASRMIDELCDRRFWADSDATQVRYYTPCCYPYLDTDDIVSLTAVATDLDGDGTFETVWSATDYMLEPFNAAADGWPYTRISMTSLGTQTFPAGMPRSVKVTAKFGWGSTAPAQITNATTILASMLLKRAREAPFGIVTVGIEDGAAMRIARTDPTVMALIAPYMRRRAAAA